MGPGGPHQAGGLLAAPGPPAAARPVGGAGGGHPGGPLRLSGRALSQPAHGRPVGPVLLLQLVADRRRRATTSWPPGRCPPSPTPGPWPSRSSSTWCGPWWCWPCSMWASGSTGASRSCWGCPCSGSSPRPSRWPCSTAPGPTSPGSTSAPTPTPSPSWWGRCWPASLTLIQRHRGLTGMAPVAKGATAKVILTVIGLAGFAGTLALTNQLTGTSALAYRGGFLLSALSAAAIILGAVCVAGGPIARVLSVRPLVWMGTVSYGAYLWHYPVFIELDAARTGTVRPVPAGRPGPGHLRAGRTQLLPGGAPGHGRGVLAQPQGGRPGHRRHGGDRGGGGGRDHGRGRRRRGRCGRPTPSPWASVRPWRRPARSPTTRSGSSCWATRWP